MNLFQWKAADGETMHGRDWLCPGGGRGVVVFIHGLGEHSARYDHVAAALNATGWDAAAFDHRGHGLSGGKRGDIPDYESLLSDIGMFFGRQRKKHPNKPAILWGHSMGGNLLLNYLLHGSSQHLPDKAVVTSPALQLGGPASQEVFASIAAKLAPHVTMNSRLKADQLSRDPKVVKAYQADPLVHSKISFLLAHSLYQFGKSAIHQAANLTVPTLLMHGTADSICLLQGSQDFAAKTDEVTWKTWDGWFHELHNEPDKAEFLAYVCDWLD